MEPDDVPFQVLREITDDFSDERKIGEGSFGVVYRGETHTGEDVAVKMLKPNYHNTDASSRQFKNEIYNLAMLRHQNIVQILGYCFEIEKEPMKINGEIVLVERPHRAIFLQYLQKGSLKEHLSGEFDGLDWDTRFKIIKGICEGLKYIHDELEKPLYHLDLKPENILLDEDMVPKIADFGLSRIFGKGLTRITEDDLGTRGYQPPEYIERCEVSEKFDVFSLGVIMIEIVSGREGYNKYPYMGFEDFVKQVLGKWRHRLHGDSSVEKYCHQVEKCTRIALDCVQMDSTRRPDIVEVTQKLNGHETDIGKVPQKGYNKVVSKITRQEPNEIKGQHQNIKSKTSPSCSELGSVDGQETSTDVVDELIVGRTQEKTEIMASLSKVMSEKIVILPIHGIAGIGKTTFARLIYNDPEFKCYSQVWVYVSQRFDLNRICESIISQLSEKESQAKERQMTNRSLANLLSGKKILIVLDDLWEDNQMQLQDLKNLLYHDDSNIIILVTTRSECVAERIYTNHEPYKILPLSNDMCWYIIKQRSDFEARDDREQLTSIGLEIAHRCGGVALAAQSLGFTLQSMNFDQWLQVRDSDIWNGTISNNVLASLMLSYSYMAPCLKLCFAYCAIFPKGDKIDKDDMIYQWISLDFIKPTKLLSNMQLCETYIAQLLGLSFFQHFVSPKTSGEYHEETAFFTMHDLVHDLAVSILDDQILDHSKQGNVMGTNYQYALLSDRSTPQESLMTPPATLTALRFLDSNTTTVLDVSVFAPATSLRVLDLRVRATLNLPDSIGQLKQLRYLSAPDIIDKMVPECISEFSNLIYLRLWGSSIVELPNSIGELKSIMHLDLSYCSALNQLPESLWNLSALIYLKLRGCHIVALPESIGELKNLRHLDLSYCFKLQQLPASFSNLSALNYLNLSKSSIVALPESIGELKKLRHLDLSYCSSLPQLPASFRNIGKLEHLNLSCCYHISSLSELLWRLSGLEYLNLKHCLNIGDLIGQLGGLTKLQYLNLARDMYGYDDNLSGLPTFLVNLTKLRYLNLANCLDKDESLISLDSICELSNLEHLDLQGNRHLYMIPDAIRNLSKLHTLNLSGCSQLRRLPVSMSKINSLKFLRVSDCSCLDMSTLPQNRKELNMFPYFVVHASDGESTSNICGLEYEDGPFLKILMLENVKSAEEAQRIELGEKKMIKKLELAWTGGAKRFIDDERILEQLRPPATVENFVLQGYKSVSFPSWMMDDIATFLPRLKFITLQGLPSCDKLPPLGWLPNLIALYILEMDKIRKIDMDFYGGKTDAFPKLNLLKLQHMEHLEEWDTACMFPKLSVLDVKYCPMLRFRSGLPLSSCNTSNKLSIFGSDNVILSPLVDSGASSSTATYRLDVHCCEAPLDQWVLLHHLHCLEDLRIKNCSNLTCRSAEILQCLSSLKALSVKKFNSALELPEWLGDITSLKKLKVSKCEGIRTLPDSIQEVKCIEHLEVKKCPELIQWCKSKENEMKLAHIKAIILDGELFKFDWEPDTEEETNLMYLRVNASASSTNSLAAVESILAAPVRDYCSVFSSVNPIQGADLPLTALPEGVTACAVLARTVVEPVQEAAEIMENQGPITAAPRKRRASKLEEPERRETPRSKRLMKHPMA